MKFFETNSKGAAINLLPSTRQFVLGLSMLFAFSFTSCDDDGSEIVRIDKSSFSVEDQKDFGNNLQRIFENNPDEFSILDRSIYKDLYDHLDITFRTLTQQTSVVNRDAFDWELVILKDDDQAMAFCAPGGKFFIYTGLLKFLTGEHELVGVMAHEMYYSNSGKAMDAILGEFGSVPFLLGDIFLNNANKQSIDVATYMKDHSYTSSEVDAGDKFALEVICPFQYNPSGLSALIKRGEGVQWKENRTGSDERLMLLEDMQSKCGNLEDDPTFAERYLGFIANLP